MGWWEVGGEGLAHMAASQGGSPSLVGGLLAWGTWLLSLQTLLGSCICSTNQPAREVRGHCPVRASRAPLGSGQCHTNALGDVPGHSSLGWLGNWGALGVVGKGWQDVL